MKSSRPDEFFSKLNLSSHVDSISNSRMPAPHADFVSDSRVNVPTPTPIAYSKCRSGLVHPDPSQHQDQLHSSDFEHMAYSRSIGRMTRVWVAAEIDRTLYRLRKTRSIDVGGSSSFISILDSFYNNCTTNQSDFSESNCFDSRPNISDN
ncbi:hypothetical protein CR513_11681, partial [Mucuna pruriens]